ncbi:branched-chain amino acid aminotransferase 2, chloroplastic isoform X4 [Cryptomeria japonica]|uniref:branched-chain amino acid aminotransferase 2, chloroplastic isoform X4 n=1 Tax=Cryptomeria japonica TaxID=3369 RepID=UPI0027DA4DF4|nr:branched-chain amino acid aminotransferase 2, chloroplastic isoform X4 [Cryptomeria japonica]
MTAAAIRRIKKSVKDCEELRTRASILSVKITEVEEETAKANSWRRSNRVCKQLPCYNFLLNSLAGRNNVEKSGFALGFRPWSSSIGTCMNRFVQGLFEGLKAYRTTGGRTILFRPEENALRMQMGADRLCMPAPSVEQFVNAVKQTVLANKRWIPPSGKGSLYIRILLMGSGPILGLGPAPEVTFLTFVSPVGNYFKEGLKPIHLQVERMHHRSTPGGTGGVKAIGNYAPALRVLSGAKAKGFSDVIYLDSVNKKYIEEVSSCNIFLKKGNIISTPALHGTVLPGVTRKSIIALARTRGYEVQERLVSIDELLDADEVFCTGTAVVVSPVGSVSYLERRVTYRSGSPGGVSEELYSALTSIQLGLAEDSMGWTFEVK